MNISGFLSEKKVFIIAAAVIILGGGGFLGYLFLTAQAPEPLEERVASKRVQVTPQVGAPVETAQTPAVIEKVEKKEELAAVKKEVKPLEREITKEVPKKPTEKKPLAAPKPWVVHVASFKSKQEADGIKDKLSKGGYHAYLTEFTKDGDRWYRVRVGFYSTEDEAEKEGRAISKKFSTGEPWILKAGKDEVAKYMK